MTTPAPDAHDDDDEPAPACSDHPSLDPDDWFGDAKTSPATRRAITVCMTDCPVRATCLEQVLTFSEQPVGIWAGLSQPERARIAPAYRKRHRISSRNFRHILAASWKH